MKKMIKKKRGIQKMMIQIENQTKLNQSPNDIIIIIIIRIKK
jgi:hypothetical protein